MLLNRPNEHAETMLGPNYTTPLGPILNRGCLSAHLHAGAVKLAEESIEMKAFP